MFAQVIIDIAHTAVDKTFTYCIPDGLAVASGHLVLVPFGQGNALKEGFVVSLAESCDVCCKSILKLVLPYPILTAEQLALADWIAKSYRCLLVDALRLMIPPQLRGARVKERIEKTVRLAEGVDTAVILPAMRSPLQREVLGFVAEGGLEFSCRDIAAYIPGAAAAIRALVKKGLVVEGNHVTFRRPQADAAPSGPPVLTEQQQAAVDQIEAKMASGGETVLLHGVTGSGKTEVYLRCIADCLTHGRGAIVLVPEIFILNFKTTVSRNRKQSRRPYLKSARNLISLLLRPMTSIIHIVKMRPPMTFSFVFRRTKNWPMKIGCAMRAGNIMLKAKRK